MNDEIPNLMQHVHQYFTRIFQERESAPGAPTFLAFEGVPIPLTADMFKLHPDDPDFWPDLAVEHLSLLSNTVPALDANVYQRTGRTVEEAYALLLNGAQHRAPGSDAAALFAALKHQALQAFDQAIVGSLQGPFQFHPAYATPTTWYDAESEAWTEYTFSDSGAAPAPPPSPPALRIDPNLVRWSWKVLPPQSRAVLERRELLAQIVPLMTAIEEEDDDKATDEPPTPVRRGASRPLRSRSTLSLGGFANLGNRAARVSSDDTGVRIRLPAARRASNLLTISAIRQPLLEAARLSQLARQAQPAAATMSGLRVSLRYCLVSISRPWISQAMLELPDWYVPGFGSGGISTGDAAANEGLFPAFPVACLVAKDLRIEANWTPENLAVASQAMMLGPFSLVGRQVNQASGTISAPGMHIIGWICQLMPQLPPVGDASLAPL